MAKVQSLFHSLRLILTTLSNLTGLKRVQSASVDFAFARERLKQIGSPDYVGQVQVKNADIGLNINYLYSNGTNEAMMGLNVNGEDSTALKYVKKENQDRNYYILMGTGDNDAPNTTEIFKNQFNIMALGNVFLNSYSLSASVGSAVSVSSNLSAYNVVMNEYNDSVNGETIPAIDTTKVGPGEPVLDKNYKITSSAFQNTTNRDGNIHAAFTAGDIELILANVNEPGIEFTGSSPVRSASIDSLDIDFNIERTDLYGLGSMYPYGKRAVLPILGTLSFSALATEFTSGNLNEFLSGQNDYNFTFNLKDNCSGITGLQLKVENAQLDSQGLSDTMGDNASITASFGFSMSDISGLKISTPPLIVNQPVAAASDGATLYVQPTGKTSGGAAYNTDGFKYEWYKGASLLDLNLVANGTFTSDVSWTDWLNGSSGGTVVITGGQLKITQGSNSVWMGAYQSGISLISGKTYTLKGKYTGGGLIYGRVYVGTTYGDGSYFNPGNLSGVGGVSYEWSFTASTTDADAYITLQDGQSATNIGYWEDVSLVESGGQRSVVTSGADDYYVVVSNELGSATSNTSSVT